MRNKTPAEADALGYLGEDQALGWHLQHNHYPPVSLKFLPVAKQALKLARSGDFISTIALPSGNSRTVMQLIEDLHLQFFIEAGAE